MLIRLRPLATILSIAALLLLAPAAMAGHALAAKVAAARAGGQAFTEATLFTSAEGAKHSDMLARETLLRAIPGAAASLCQSHPEALSITLRTAAGKAYTLEMLRAYPTGDAPDMGTIDAGGRHKAAYTAGVHYQGALAGDGESMAAASVFPNGDVAILFSNEEGNFNLGRLEDGSGNFILYNDADMLHPRATKCATPEPVPGTLETGGKGKAAKALLCNKVRVYWELSYNVYTSKGSSLTTAQNYATSLFNQFQALYANESIAMELGSLYIWTAQDDYPTASSRVALYAFRAYWNSLGNGFNGDLAHLITRDNNGNGGNGGVAFLDGLCNNRPFAYGYSDIYGTVNTVPTFSWDVEVVSHETGHNLGSPHTHWCGWNTGSGGACGAIDDCYTLENGSGCNTCGSTYSNTAPVTAWKGTVMSYCHLVSRGINLANGFGPLPGALVRSNVGQASCLASTMSVSLTPQPICSGTGGVMLQFAGNHFGTAPYTYSWSSGAKTQNLANVTTAGDYTVTVADSNGCITAVTATVKQGAAPGNGVVPQPLKMPVCCNVYNAPLRLKASAAPRGVDFGCQNVYWTRSAAPFANYGEAQAFLDTATVSVMPSTNDALLSGGTTAAALDVIPAPCTAPITWYYTPVVVQRPHVADSFVYTNGSVSNSGFSVYSTTIGAAATVPDQTAARLACDVVDTPTARSLTVTVSSYSGRANKLRIVILDAIGYVIYESAGLSGNGTYSIPAAAINGDFLAAMKVIAMDYNCITNSTGNTTTCTSSSARVDVARKQVYGAHPLKAAPAACGAGTAIRVDFAPSGCTKLAANTAVPAAPEATLFPNPASGSTTLRFNALVAGSYSWKVTDMLGKTLFASEGTYSTGTHEARIDVRGWAKGVYFVRIGAAGGEVGGMKLVVE